MALERRLVQAAVLIFLTAISAGVFGEEGVLGLPRESFSAVCHFLAVLAAAAGLMVKGSRMQSRRVQGLDFSDPEHPGKMSQYRWVSFQSDQARPLETSHRMAESAK